MARRNRNKNSTGVKGPHSALTEFLKSEGITDAFRQRREREANSGNGSGNTSQTGTPEPNNSGTNNNGDNESQDTSINNSNVSSRNNSPILSRRTSQRGNSITPDKNNKKPDDEDEEEDEEIQLMRKAAKRKLKAASKNSRIRKRRTGGQPDDSSSDSSDDDSGDDNAYTDTDDEDLGDADMKKFGDKDICVDCGNEFELSVFSRFINEKSGYLCDSCNKILKERERKAKANQLNARKKRKRVAQALLNKSTVKIPKLQDVCIKKITENIEDVDVLGDIGHYNLNKISSILSKNRSLNDKTISLFLSPDLKQISFWDCSNVDSDSLNKIASFCPNLESLTLFMCGQLHNDNLEYFASNMKNLNSLSLNGPFLISDKMWQAFFDHMKGRLIKFEVRNTHRFGNESLQSLLINCGSDLTSLKLSRLDGLTSLESYKEISSFIGKNKVQHLEISYPTNEDIINDDIIIDILQKTGESLISLNVDGCSALTDKFLIEGVTKYCSNLTKLSMKNLDQVSNEGFTQAFNEYSKINVGGLLEVNLMKCSDLGDSAIYSLLNHSCHTLVELSINSLFKISNEFLSQISTNDHHQFKKLLKEKIDNNESSQQVDENGDELHYYHEIHLPLLTYLDCSFVRSVDNEILSLIGNHCPKLQIIEVYGDNRCNGKATFRDDLMVIGRQSDEL
ncbi:RAD7 [Candida pseudojiufengensis]|uniref:RAD7 n=1 Tax=Candida pseudojiufengensis TaxID=497109 RepID=UPI002224EE5F|nr:RAD7 [Candida pseudojiufengensis]KAI5963317.1 RAD7 [Candida pseudojiufengensis]